jgi:hypothetical protein
MEPLGTLATHKYIQRPADGVYVPLNAQVCLRRLVTGLLPRRPGVRDRVSPYGICCGQRGTGTGFSPEFFVFPSQYHSTMSLYTHISSGGWTIGLFVAAVQRHSLTPPTWISAALSCSLFLTRTCSMPTTPYCAGILFTSRRIQSRCFRGKLSLVPGKKKAGA